MGVFVVREFLVQSLEDLSVEVYDYDVVCEAVFPKQLSSLFLLAWGELFRLNQIHLDRLIEAHSDYFVLVVLFELESHFDLTLHDLIGS